MKKALFARLAIIAAVTTPMASFAVTTAPDFSTLTSQIDMSTTITAIMAIGVACMGLLIAIKGVKNVWKMFKGA